MRLDATMRGGDVRFDAAIRSALPGSDVTVKPLTVTENGTYQEPKTAYSPVTVDVAGLVPTGTLEITKNGTYDVTEKASAHVSVPQRYPSGGKTITQNGRTSVAWLAQVFVEVPTFEDKLAAILDGTATSLTGLPSSLTKIKPYAFYSSRKSAPSGYVLLEYAESVENVYLLTNISYRATSAYRFEIDLQGTRVLNDRGIGWNAGGGVYTRNGKYTNGTSADAGVIAMTDRVVATIYIPVSGNSEYRFVRYSDGYISTSSRAHGSIAIYANINYPLFAMSNLSGLNDLLYIPVRIYSFKAWENDILVSDFVPVARNGEVGMYNRVDGQFYSSGGTGSLIGGAEIPGEDADSIETAYLNVTEIGAYAFYNNKLSSLTLLAPSVVTLGDHALDGTPIADGTGSIYVPASLVSDYKADPAWAVYAGQIMSI